MHKFPLLIFFANLNYGTLNWALPSALPNLPGIQQTQNGFYFHLNGYGGSEVHERASLTVSSKDSHPRMNGYKILMAGSGPSARPVILPVL